MGHSCSRFAGATLELDGTTSLILVAITFVSGLFLWATREREEVSATANSLSQSSITELATLAAKMEQMAETSAHPTDLLANEDFKRAVTILSWQSCSIEQASNYASGANWILRCAAFESMLQRKVPDNEIEKALKAISTSGPWPLFFLLKFVEAKSTKPVAGRVVAAAQYWWRNSAPLTEAVGKYLEGCIAAEETIVIGPAFAELESEDRVNVREFINVLPDKVKTTLNKTLDEHESQAVDEKYLRSVGELLGPKQFEAPVFETQQIHQLVQDVQDEASSGAPKSILVVGQPGVGKTSLRRIFAKKLLDSGWKVFKTSGPSLIADKVYIGQIEGQVKKLVANASSSKRVVLYIDRLAELSEFGRTSKSDSSILDQLWPSLESRTMFMITETTPSGLQAMVRRYPSLPTVFKVVQMQAVDEGEASKLAGDLLDHLCGDIDRAQRTEVLSESMQLAQQFLSHKSLPGSVLSLLELAVARARRDGEQVPNREHVQGALSQISGLPREVLDDRQQLDIEGVRQSFQRKVIGQDDAVDCLVERIAMLKAGLTDPDRPVGVFLFAGPTGTGKTEIAKTLSEMLFGSPEQMIRLDMSEYQDPDSVWRLLGQNSKEVAAGSLVARIREQPFSVVLLDEFEKAHQKVWDIFLQVFDDGRLSDSNGEAADFRHAIIILTSNLGATINSEAGVGFTSSKGAFVADDVMRTINRTFRREFVNRLDQVVVFNPLGRDVMRAILQKELKQALGRRGLRTKQWAVEWEDSAVEFLLDEGFTPDLGARPLRRAIEKHLLAPLSMTIVQNKAPDGEQFLFIRSNGEALQVEFIDPDAEPEDDDEEAVVGDVPSTSDIDLSQLMLSTSAPDGAADYLFSEMSTVQDRVGSNEWARSKAELIAELNEKGFWERADRHVVLDRIELADRLDSAASILAPLAERLGRSSSNTKLVKSIANRLYVLREGMKDLDEKRATQALIGVRLVTEDAKLDSAEAFRNSLVEMYQNWARARGMRLRKLATSGSRYESLFLISGFGSHGILQPESGLHVYEIPTGGKKFDRIRARVQVAPVPTEGAEKQSKIDKEATAILDADDDQKVVIVRRYRQEPSPLARDSVRNWRTGRLDQVLSGNFDVI